MGPFIGFTLLVLGPTTVNNGLKLTQEVTMSWVKWSCEHCEVGPKISGSEDENWILLWQTAMVMVGC